MRAGKIQIASELLCQWLQFPYGKIIDADFNVANELIELTIQDEEMPEIKEGMIPVVSLTFHTYQNSLGDKVAIREPIEPPT